MWYESVREETKWYDALGVLVCNNSKLLKDHGQGIDCLGKAGGGTISMAWIFFEAQQIVFSFRLEGKYQSIKRIAFYPIKSNVIFDRNFNCKNIYYQMSRDLSAERVKASKGLSNKDLTSQVGRQGRA